MMTWAPYVPPGIDTTVATPARTRDCLLGGQNNFEADRRAAAQILAACPGIRDAAFANRGFHRRAAAWIARHGVRQFLDIGSGLPTAGNTHEVTQRVIPDVCVVYADSDPMVQLHSLDTLAGQETIGAVLGDPADPASVLDSPDVRMLIDFRQPVGLLMTGALHHVPGRAGPHDLLRRYLSALAPGSYLALSHLTGDHQPPAAAAAFRAACGRAGEPVYLRAERVVEQFFGGLEIVPPYAGAAPGLCFTGAWGAGEPLIPGSDGSRWLYCGAGRKP